MRQLHKAISLLVFCVLGTMTFQVQAQPKESGGRLLTLAPESGFPIIPVLEGWTANPDGSTSFSFGFYNRNKVAVSIPVGENNFIEPAKYDNGMQPSFFPPGRDTGVFTVTISAADAETAVWWHLQTDDAEELKVPGRRGVGAYELDFILPRPQGAMQPLAGFGEDGPLAAGLMAQVGDFPGRVTAGLPVTLTVNVSDPSVRDTTDPRFSKPLAVGVVFTQHQGPGVVTFEHHESTVAVTENPYEPDDPRFRRFRPAVPGQVSVEGGQGLAKVIATFPEPGEYMIRARADTFSGPDSSEADQCCWTNILQRVTVSP